jgi:protein arginine kinase activator
MLCSICKEREATVHLAEFIGGKLTSVDTCEACAKTKANVEAPETGFAIAELLLAMEQSARSENPK